MLHRTFFWKLSTSMIAGLQVPRKWQGPCSLNVPSRIWAAWQRRITTVSCNISISQIPRHLRHIIFMLFYYWYNPQTNRSHGSIKSLSSSPSGNIAWASASLGFNPSNWISEVVGSYADRQFSAVESESCSPQAVANLLWSTLVVPWWWHGKNIFRADPSQRWSRCHWFVTCN